MWARLRTWVTGNRTEPLDPTRTDLVIVVASFDDAEACSTALERGADGTPRWTEDAEAVLRHHLELPIAAVDEAIALAGQDGYVRVPATGGPSDPEPADRVSLILQRVQVLDALHCAQEKSRMASLAQRLGGDAHGWDALQPGTAD
ncbi:MULTISPECIES: hypothetical protein [Rhodococcus]|uniref:hypothetical protein n=2 Tax=Rhodococcus TaxID=1827 RepID=UPI001CF8D285|nr:MULTISPECIES: hypothetical protein [Rhodococcus]